jgi:predicted transcriptional regulator
MSESTGEQSYRFIELTGEIVAAYVSRNHVAGSDLPALIASVHAAITGQAVGQPAPKEEAVDRPTPAQIRKSVTPDALISFIDGTPYKTLKRHLTKHGFTPETYRERFGLPVDYPMVAASYSETRSNLARSLGLGQTGSRSAKSDQVPPAPKGRRKAA